VLQESHDIWTNHMGSSWAVDLAGEEMVVPARSDSSRIAVINLILRSAVFIFVMNAV
jgi:hypothetical protein